MGGRLDSETGLYNYGARYYDPSLSIWMGVDPLADKFYSWSPYHYATNNPINIIDYDGRDTLPTSFSDIKTIGGMIADDTGEAFSELGSYVGESYSKMKSKIGSYFSGGQGSDGVGEQNGGVRVSRTGGLGIGGLRSKKTPGIGINIDGILEAASISGPAMGKSAMYKAGSKVFGLDIITKTAQISDASAKLKTGLEGLDNLIGFPPSHHRHSHDIDFSGLQPGQRDTFNHIIHEDTVPTVMYLLPLNQIRPGGPVGGSYPLNR